MAVAIAAKHAAISPVVDAMSIVAVAVELNNRDGNRTK